MKVWILVPARGGSKGIPRKNVRPLGGQPLIVHVLTALQRRFDRTQIIVSTDDDEIARLIAPFAVCHVRSAEIAADASTLDDVAVAVAHWLLQRGATNNDLLLTVQPTSPFITADTIERAIALFDAGVSSVISVKDDRHLRWTRDADGHATPLYEQRVNRQWLPETWAETGGVIGARIGRIIADSTRIQHPIALLPLSTKEGLDIDGYADWAVAEFYLSRRRIVVRADAAPALGMGHVYRALALAHVLSEHDLRLVTRSDGDFALGADFLRRHPYELTTVADESAFIDFLADFAPDITIRDVLDSAETTMQRIKPHTRKLVALEDLGPGARLADLVINDLYTDFYPQENHWYGVENAILNPQFETIQPQPFNPVVDHILIAFGGTDPQNLTHKAVVALERCSYDGTTTVVLGPGYEHETPAANQSSVTIVRTVDNMAQLMQSADLAITSAGRTVTELMTLGVPLLVLCQNNRELRHTHASSPHGVINLGLGNFVDGDTLTHHLRLLIDDADLRRDMRYRALQATQNRSNSRIVQRILDATV